MSDFRIPKRFYDDHIARGCGGCGVRSLPTKGVTMSLPDPEQYDLAILLEDFQEMPDEAHESRQHWGGPDSYKPRLLNGRRIVPGRSVNGDR